jgi:excisionase family DNA binding protein
MLPWIKRSWPSADKVYNVNYLFHLAHVTHSGYASCVPTKEHDMAELMQVRETARALGVSENTIRRWEERGLIPAIRLPSGVRRFRREDVEAAQARMYEGLPPLAESDDVISTHKATPID